MHRIHLSAADIGASERDAVAAVMRSPWIAPAGPEIEAFEHEIASYVGVAHGVAVSSGTAALHLALLAAGVGSGSVVVTSTFTFAATANAIAYTGAEPMFIDCDLETGNIDIALLREALVGLRTEGKRIGAILPVDIYGKSADHVSIEALAAEFEVPVVVDSAESLGASLAGRRAGAFGACAAVSFNGNKIMTTSGGGMLLTENRAIARQARRLATQARQPVAHYEHAEIGFNYRLSNVLAALGRAQLTRLDTMIQRRRAIRERYREVLAGVDGVSILGGDDDHDDNCWLTCLIFSSNAAADPRSVAAHLDREGIETRQLWKPMHLQPVFSGRRCIISGAAEQLFTTGLSLPSGSSLSDTDVDRVCDSLDRALRIPRD